MSERKYDSDGHNVDPNADVIQTGTIIRMVSKDGGIGPFSDTTIIGIWLELKNGNKHTYATLAMAISKAKEEYGMDYERYNHRVVVELARPYLYASSIGICFNWLTGVEKFSTTPNHIMTMYRVVEMSTGKPATYNNRQ